MDFILRLYDKVNQLKRTIMSNFHIYMLEKAKFASINLIA